MIWRAKREISIVAAMVLVIIGVPFILSHTGVGYEWVTAGAGSALAVVAFMAIFGDEIRLWIKRPDLDIRIRLSPPDCHRVPVTTSDPYGYLGIPPITADSYYFRIRIINRGTRPAEQVEVFAAELQRKQADGTFRTVDSFVPMNLRWAHFHTAYVSAILPDMYKHCDLFHIIDPKKRKKFSGEEKQWEGVDLEQTVLSFDTVVMSTTLGHLQYAGTYHLKLIIAAANSTPVRRTLEIVLRGDWFADEGKMLGEGVGVSVV